jgi:hypothetical protein
MHKQFIVENLLLLHLVQLILLFPNNWTSKAAEVICDRVIIPCALHVFSIIYTIGAANTIQIKLI